jgi:prepilin-type N-terminal cleavage/methylation domain-containing protein
MRKKIAKHRTFGKPRRDAGLTLIELVVALSLACIVFFAAATILVFGQKSLNRGWEQANLQRDASYAMLKMKQSIRSATQATLDEDGNGVKIFHTAGWIRFWWLPGPKDLLYQLEGEDQQLLLDGVAEQAHFTVGGNKVTIDLTLENNNYQTHLLSTTMMRNYAAGP